MRALRCGSSYRRARTTWRIVQAKGCARATARLVARPEPAICRRRSSAYAKPEVLRSRVTCRAIIRENHLPESLAARSRISRRSGADLERAGEGHGNLRRAGPSPHHGNRSRCCIGKMPDGAKYSRHAAGNMPVPLCVRRQQTNRALNRRRCNNEFANGPLHRFSRK